jgi:formamidopyrimidine-DNA glycosylase
MLRKPVPRSKIREHVAGCQVESIRRRAKYLLIALSNGALMIFHLGMTGKLGIFDKKQACRAHDHLRFLLDNGKELRFHDVRRFGFLEVLTPAEAVVSDPFAGLGPEPFAEEFSAAYMEEKTQQRNKPIKNVLMDNAVVVGIGNIYASEILFASKVKPTKPAREISHAQWQTIVKQSRIILQKAIEAGGTTISDFENASGKPGYFQLQLAVYGKSGQPCPRCGTPISRLVMAGRATYFCHSCQK